MNGTTFIDVEGRHTRVRVEGEAGGTPILLLHGIARSLEDWELQFARYRDAGFRVIPLDLPGSGFSVRIPVKTALPGSPKASLRRSTRLAKMGPCTLSEIRSVERARCSCSPWCRTEWPHWFLSTALVSVRRCIQRCA